MYKSKIFETTKMTTDILFPTSRQMKNSNFHVSFSIFISSKPAYQPHLHTSHFPSASYKRRKTGVKMLEWFNLLRITPFTATRSSFTSFSSPRLESRKLSMSRITQGKYVQNVLARHVWASFSLGSRPHRTCMNGWYGRTVAGANGYNHIYLVG